MVHPPKALFGVLCVKLTAMLSKVAYRLKQYQIASLRSIKNDRQIVYKAVYIKSFLRFELYI
jgi:hypothetical protein